MQEKGNIEELFKSAFDQFEEPVRPELWSQISGKMNPATPHSDVATVAKQATGISKIISGGGLWIAGAAIVVTTAAVFYLKPSADPKLNVQNATVENTVAPKATDGIPENATTTAAHQETTIESTNGSRLQKQIITTTSSAPTSTSETIAAQPATNQENTINSTVENHAETAPIPNSTQAVSSNQPLSGSGITGTTDDKGENDGTADSHRPVIQVFPLTGTAPLTISCLFSGAAESASWNLGDGTIIDNQKPFNHTFTAPGEYQLTLTTTDQNGKKHHAFTKVVVKSDNLLTNIPNIFTPNGDGRNDFFKIESDKDIDFEATIIDKSGKTIYSWKGIENGWDGKLSSGAEAEKGTYFYVIFATASDKIKHTYKGTLTLIR